MHSSRVRTVRCSGRLSYHAHTPQSPLPTMYALCHTHTFHHAYPHSICMPPPFAIHTSLLVNRITDSCKNITCPQLLLQMVITRPNLYSAMADSGSPGGGCHATVLQNFCEEQYENGRSIRIRHYNDFSNTHDLDMSPFCGATDTPVLDFW